ncbi:MAG: DUF58 domain-containing protein [Thermoanaerobaculia bacterium]
MPLLLIVAAASLGVPLLPELVWPLAAVLLGLVFAAAGEATVLSRVRLVAERPKSVVLLLGQPETVTLEVRGSGARSLRLVVRQRWPRLLLESSTRRLAICRPKEVLSVHFQVQGVQRGSARIERPVIASTIWNLVERITEVGDETELSVIPNLREVGRLHARFNQLVLRGLGSRTSARLGKGREFDRLRDYVQDDDHRDIAWKASARHGRLIVREFRLDRSQEILLCVDRGHRMAARVGHLSRLDHAIQAALLMAYSGNRMEDRVGVLSFAEVVEQGVAPGRGGAHLRRLTEFTTRMDAAYRHTDYLALAAHLRRRLRHRTLIMLLTSLPVEQHQNELVQAAAILSSQHLMITMAMSDPALEAVAAIEPCDRKSLCRNLVARDILFRQRMLIRELRGRGTMVVETTPTDVGLDAVNAYIDVKRRQLL